MNERKSKNVGLYWFDTHTHNKDEWWQNKIHTSDPDWEGDILCGERSVCYVKLCVWCEIMCVMWNYVCVIWNYVWCEMCVVWNVCAMWNVCVMWNYVLCEIMCEVKWCVMWNYVWCEIMCYVIYMCCEIHVLRCVASHILVVRSSFCDIYVQSELFVFKYLYVLYICHLLCERVKCLS